MKTLTATFAITLIATLGLYACGKDETKGQKNSESGKAAKSAPEAKQPATPPKQQAGESATHFATGMMVAYEECRAELASDKTDGIADCATKFASAAKSAHADAPEAAHEHIGAAVAAANALLSTKTDDIDAVRLAFGELSKPVVDMLIAAPGVAKDYHVFECPMAKGYKRWAQPDGELKNPYMGQAMLACGSEMHDHHTASQDGADGHTGH